MTETLSEALGFVYEKLSRDYEVLDRHIGLVQQHEHVHVLRVYPVQVDGKLVDFFECLYLNRLCLPGCRIVSKQVNLFSVAERN